MDADTRHQLKTNELGEALSKLRSFSSDRQTRLWLLVIVLVLAAWGAYRYWNYARVASVTQAWYDLEQINRKRAAGESAASTMAELKTLIDGTSNPAVRTTARIRLAATLHQQAEENPDEYDEYIKQAVAALEPVLSDTEAPPALVAAAMFALATDHESLRQYDEAQTLYEKLRDDERFVGSPFYEAADMRLETLDELRQRVTFLPGSAPPPAPPPPPASQPEQPPISVMPANAAMPLEPIPEPVAKKPEENATGETQPPAEPEAVPPPPSTQPVP
ncbi:MAG: hypothetical protein PVJ57_22220 [Phycisphaerae bacterium]|jgi:predicted negative regulator of RcsB-dependent stress response